MHRTETALTKTGWLLGGRYSTLAVKVYDGFSVDYLSTQTGNVEFPIDKHACFMVSGEDHFHYNKMSYFE